MFRKILNFFKKILLCFQKVKNRRFINICLSNHSRSSLLQYLTICQVSRLLSKISVLYTSCAIERLLFTLSRLDIKCSILFEVEAKLDLKELTTDKALSIAAIFSCAGRLIKNISLKKSTCDSPDRTKMLSVNGKYITTVWSNLE